MHSFKSEFFPFAEFPFSEHLSTKSARSLDVESSQLNFAGPTETEDEQPISNKQMPNTPLKATAPPCPVLKFVAVFMFSVSR